MDTNAYVTFLVLGVVLVALDGQIIYRSGQKFLENSYGDPGASASMTRLITVMFHLAVLGILALLSIVDFGVSNPIEAVVAKLGVMLLILAIAHGITLAVLGRLRDEQIAETVTATRRANAAMGTRSAAQQFRQESVVTPVPGQPGRDPQISPSLDAQGNGSE
jgi:hypothetical protein